MDLRNLWSRACSYARAGILCGIESPIQGSPLQSLDAGEAMRAYDADQIFFRRFLLFCAGVLSPS